MEADFCFSLSLTVPPIHLGLSYLLSVAASKPLLSNSKSLQAFGICPLNYICPRPSLFPSFIDLLIISPHSLKAWALASLSSSPPPLSESLRPIHPTTCCYIWVRFGPAGTTWGIKDKGEGNVLKDIESSAQPWIMYNCSIDHTGKGIVKKEQYRQPIRD